MLTSQTHTKTRSRFIDGSKMTFLKFLRIHIIFTKIANYTPRTRQQTCKKHAQNTFLNMQKTLIYVYLCVFKMMQNSSKIMILNIVLTTNLNSLPVYRWLKNDVFLRFLRFMNVSTKLVKFSRNLPTIHLEHVSKPEKNMPTTAKKHDSEPDFDDQHEVNGRTRC